MQLPHLRLLTLALASVFLTGASIANPADDTDLAARLTALEQEIATERAARLSFDLQNAILIAENAELKQKLTPFTTKNTLEDALENVIDHAAEMRQQLNESQERIEGIAHQLQLAMSQHAELQDAFAAKQRSLYAHATTLQRHLEALPTDVDYQTEEIIEAPVIAEQPDFLTLPPIAKAKAPIVEVEVAKEETVEITSVASQEAFIANLPESIQQDFESEIKPEPAVGAVVEPIIEPNPFNPFCDEPTIEAQAPEGTIPESSYFEPEPLLFNQCPAREDNLHDDEQFLGSGTKVNPLCTPLTIL